MYGWSWALGFGALSAINMGLIRMGLTHDQIAMLWPASSLLIVGVLYLAGGALWRDRFQFGLGVWILFADAVSVFAGIPANYVVLAVSGWRRVPGRRGLVRAASPQRPAGVTGRGIGARR